MTANAVLPARLIGAGALWLLSSIAARGNAQSRTVEPVTTWSLSAQPTRIIGDPSTSRELFSRIVSVAIAYDGTVMIWDPTVPGVRSYARGSTAPLLLARAGAGPGEVRAATFIGVARDTVIIVDPTLRRITRLTLSGRTISTLALQPGSDVRNPRAVGRLSDGRFVWLGNDPAFDGRRDGLRRDTVPIAISDDDGVGLRTLSHALGSTTYTALTARGGAYLGPLPFGPTTHIVAEGLLVWAIDSETPTLRAFNATGQLVRTVRVPFERAAISPAVRSAAMRRELEASPNAAIRALVQRKYASAPTESPFVSGLAVAPSGDLWVTSFVPQPNQPARVAVLSQSGALRATLTLPPRLRIVALTEQEVVAVHRDDDDVESVHVYAIERER